MSAAGLVFGIIVIIVAVLITFFIFAKKRPDGDGYDHNLGPIMNDPKSLSKLLQGVANAFRRPDPSSLAGGMEHLPYGHVFQVPRSAEDILPDKKTGAVWRRDPNNPDRVYPVPVLPSSLSSLMVSYAVRGGPNGGIFSMTVNDGKPLTTTRLQSGEQKSEQLNMAGIVPIIENVRVSASDPGVELVALSVNGHRLL